MIPGKAVKRKYAALVLDVIRGEKSIEAAGKRLSEEAGGRLRLLRMVSASRIAAELVDVWPEEDAEGRFLLEISGPLVVGKILDAAG